MSLPLTGDVLDANALSQLAALIASRSTFRHVTHVNPDADGFGSALAMSRHLRRLGKDSQVVITGKLPRRLEWLVRDDEVRVFDDASTLPADAVFFLYDFSALRRLGALESVSRSSMRRQARRRRSWPTSSRRGT